LITRNLLTLFILSSFTNIAAIEPYELWWENALENTVSIDMFKSWLGDVEADTRVLMRNYVKKNNFKSILDIPCGLCTDYYGFLKDNISIEYLGVDITKKLVNRALEFSIPAKEGNIEELSFETGSFEFVYARHILEHLPSYEKALKELIRVASSEVYIVFFIKPQDDLLENKINLDVTGHAKLYHNMYKKNEINDFLNSQKEVLRFDWEDANSNEIILHIHIKQETL
jgi:ubiquinone/menaquinone biosynthesis C-methylase UbiE